MAHDEGRGFRTIPSADLVVNIGDVTLYSAIAKDQRLGYLAISLTLREELQYLPLALRQVRGIFPCPGRLDHQVFLPGGHLFHQGPHPQLSGDGQRLVQQGDGLLPVVGDATLEQRVGVVMAGPGQLRTVAALAAEGESFLEVAGCLV